MAIWSRVSSVGHQCAVDGVTRPGLGELRLRQDDVFACGYDKGDDGRRRGAGANGGKGSESSSCPQRRDGAVPSRLRPFGPCVPLRSRGPVVPVVPGAPGVPLVPSTPLLPASPFEPRTPSAPLIPFAPSRPARPRQPPWDLTCRSCKSTKRVLCRPGEQSRAERPLLDVGTGQRAVLDVGTGQQTLRSERAAAHREHEKHRCEDGH